MTFEEAVIELNKNPYLTATELKVFQSIYNEDVPDDEKEQYLKALLKASEDHMKMHEEAEKGE